MRTTLDIADDVLQAAKELARRKGTTAGRVISDLARQALREGPAPAAGRGTRRRPSAFLGFRPFAGRGGIVTDEIVNDLRQAEPD
jgi:hypothetical protein